MIGFQGKVNKLQGVPIVVKILLCQTWVKQCYKSKQKKVKDMVKDHHSAVT